MKYKLLSHDQTRYIINHVALPRLEYLTQCCLLSDRDISKIFTPLKKIFKHSLNSPQNTSDSILFSNTFHSIYNFSDIHLKHHFSLLNCCFNDPLTSTIALQRLVYTLQHELWIPSLHIDSISDILQSIPTSFSYFSQMLKKLIPAGLFLATSFTPSIIGGNSPIRSILTNLSTSQISSLRRKRIIFLDQISSIDG